MSKNPSLGVHVQRRVPEHERFAPDGWETVAVYRFQYGPGAVATKDWLAARHPREEYRVHVVKPGAPGMAQP